MMHGNEVDGMSGWFGLGHGVPGLLFWTIIILIIAALLKYLFKK